MTFTITLKTPDEEQKIQCAEDQYILDAADDAGDADDDLLLSLLILLI